MGISRIGHHVLSSGGGPLPVTQPLSPGVFRQGGEWMQAWLREWAASKPLVALPRYAFAVYGWGKYGLCLSAGALSAWLLSGVSPWLTPLALLAFYVVEVHFLFLFPLLIDGVKFPAWQSIRVTYRLGLLRLLCRVLPLAGFMLLGLFRVSDPFRQWHQGCLIVLIWYQRDVRDRL